MHFRTFFLFIISLKPERVKNETTKKSQFCTISDLCFFLLVLDSLEIVTKLTSQFATKKKATRRWEQERWSNSICRGIVSARHPSILFYDAGKRERGEFCKRNVSQGRESRDQLTFFAITRKFLLTVLKLPSAHISRRILLPHPCRAIDLPPRLLPCSRVFLWNFYEKWLKLYFTKAHENYILKSQVGRSNMENWFL